MSAQALQLLEGIRVVPVVAIEDVDAAVPLADVLANAGLTVIEVTLRTPVALEAIEAIVRNVPDMTVGVGSLRTPELALLAKRAGASFAVSPGATPTLIKACEQADLPFIPGAATPSESLALLERGFSLQKLFPAKLIGGISYLQALGAPLPEVKFMPTGGVSANNATDYLSLGNVACIGGTWVVPTDLLAAKDFEGISSLARHAAQL